MSDAFALALLAAVGGGCAIVFRYLTGQIDFYRDRLFRAQDTTDESLDVAEQLAETKAPGG